MHRIRINLPALHTSTWLYVYFRRWLVWCPHFHSVESIRTYQVSAYTSTLY